MLTDEARSAGKINNFDIFWLHLILLSHFCNEFGHVLWVWVAHSKVHALVILRHMVKVILGLHLIVLVACLVHSDMFIC